MDSSLVNKTIMTYQTMKIFKIIFMLFVCNNILVSLVYRMGLDNCYIYDDCVYGIENVNVFKILVREVVGKNTGSKDKYILALEKINRKITDYSNPIIIKYKFKS